MKTNKMNPTALLTLVLFLSMGCENNPIEPAPESATISGTVTFSSNTFPTTAGSYVTISLQSVWPPEGAPYDYSIISDSDLDQEYKKNYSFDNVAFGTYRAITVSWSDPNDSNPETNQHTLGAYGGEYPFFTAYGGTDPTSVTVSTTDYSKTGLNLNADLKYVVACSKLYIESECTGQDYCTWYPAGTMGPNQTTDQCM